MKKIFALLLAALMLTGCTENSGEPYNTGGTDAENSGNISDSETAGTEETGSTPKEETTGTEETGTTPKEETTGTEETGSTPKEETTGTENTAAPPEIVAGETAAQTNNQPVSADEIENFHRDMTFEELEFSGTAHVYDGAAYTTTKYSGPITGDTAEALWQLLGDIQSGTPFDMDNYCSMGGGTYSERLTVKNTRTGREYVIYDGIIYANEGEEGGPSVIVVEGISFGGRGYVCYSSYLDSEIYLVYKLTDLIREGVVRQENIIEQTIDKPVPFKSDIVLIRSYINWAEGYQHYGSFIDFAGNVYKFDLSDNEVGSDEEFLAALEKGYFDNAFGEPVGRFDDIPFLWDIAMLSDLVSEDAVITKEHRAYDAGQTTLYAVNSEHRPVEISSDGDYYRVNTDEYALEIGELCKENEILQRLS